MKTKETSKIVCSWCNQEKEGVSAGICNHCGRFGKSNRELALKWWNSLPTAMIQEWYCDEYFKGRNAISLTWREIRQIWSCEIGKAKLLEQSTDQFYKPNQKQFKEFNSELFKAYINKFSDDDKYKCFKILVDELEIIGEDGFYKALKKGI